MAASRTSTSKTEKLPRPQIDDELVDVSLIEEMLRLSPLERLQHNDRMVETARTLRSGFARKRDVEESQS